MLPLFLMTPSGLRRRATSLEVWAAFLLLPSGRLLPAGRTQTSPGSKDHPAISRYAGSVTIGYDFRKFDELVIPLSRVEITFPPGTPVAKNNQKVEGQVTRIL